MSVARPLISLALLSLLAAALTACGSSAGALGAGPSAVHASAPTTDALPPADQITGLHVLRVSAFPTNRVAPFEVTATGTAWVQSFYAAILALKPYPPNWVAFCPLDAGVSYQLTFLRHETVAVHAVFSGGCPTVTLRGEALRVSDYMGFCQLLADALGVPRSDVGVLGQALDTAPANGPFAPTPTPSPTP